MIKNIFKKLESVLLYFTFQGHFQKVIAHLIIKLQNYFKIYEQFGKQLAIHMHIYDYV